MATISWWKGKMAHVLPEVKLEEASYTNLQTVDLRDEKLLQANIYKCLEASGFKLETAFLYSSLLACHIKNVRCLHSIGDLATSSPPYYYMVHTTKPFRTRSLEEATARLGMYKYGDGKFILVGQRPEIYIYFFKSSFTSTTVQGSMFMPTHVETVLTDVIFPPSEQMIQSTKHLLLEPAQSTLDTVKRDLLKMMQEVCQDEDKIKKKLDESLNKLLSRKIASDDIMIGRSIKQQFLELAKQQLKVTTNQSVIFGMEGVLQTTQVYSMKPDMLALNLKVQRDLNAAPRAAVAMEASEIEAAEIEAAEIKAPEEEQKKYTSAKAAAEETKTKTMIEWPRAQLYGGMEKAGGELVHYFSQHGIIVKDAIIYGMIADYAMQKCRLWKLILSFEANESTRYEGRNLLDLEDAWSRLYALIT